MSVDLGWTSPHGMARKFAISFGKIGVPRPVAGSHPGVLYKQNEIRWWGFARIERDTHALNPPFWTFGSAKT